DGGRGGVGLDPVKLARLATAPDASVRVHRHTLRMVEPGLGQEPVVEDLHRHSLGIAAGLTARSPPSTRYSEPVTNEERSLARNATTSATSAGLATRPSGWVRPHAATVSSTVCSPRNRPAAQRSIGVSTEPGQTALARIRCGA